MNRKPDYPHQEPVDVHEQQGEEQSVEEEVEGDVGDKLDAGHACGIQHFKREPVEAEPEPDKDEAETKQSKNWNMIFDIFISDRQQNDGVTKHFTVTATRHGRNNWETADNGSNRSLPGDAKANRAHVGQHVIDQVIAASSGLQVNVELGELQLDVIDVVQE